MALADFGDWLDERLAPGSVWYVKRLSANDTLANKAHQAGPYLPTPLLAELFPSVFVDDAENPDAVLDTRIDSHGIHRQVRAVWYNGELRGKTRNESRITQWGGISSPVLDPESTGAIAIFVFTPEASGHRSLRVWICSGEAEESLLEERLSVVEPGQPIVWRPGQAVSAGDHAAAAGKLLSCRLTPARMPPGWLTVFPTGLDIVRKVRELRPDAGESPDQRLIRRRDCEYELFQSLEEIIESPVISRGFTTVGEFLVQAQRILQRRKARSGRSLELQTRVILEEEGLVDGRDFSHGPESDPGKKPDFLFPGGAAYRDPRFPAERLRLLATKTTCKDRWRQVINEADRIPLKHLLTLQEGVSVTQHAEMKAAGVFLVVPQSLIRSYPKPVRSELMTLEAFIDGVRPARPTP